MLTTIEQIAGVEIPRETYGDFKPGPIPAEVTAKRESIQRRQEELRIEHSRVPVAPPPKSETKDESKFPGGIIPAALPSRRLGGRLRTRRR
jgi:hypothetical protein